MRGTGLDISVVSCCRRRRWRFAGQGAGPTSRPLQAHPVERPSRLEDAAACSFQPQRPGGHCATRPPAVGELKLQASLERRAHGTASATVAERAGRHSEAAGPAWSGRSSALQKRRCSVRPRRDRGWRRRPSSPSWPSWPSSSCAERSSRRWPASALLSSCAFLAFFFFCAERSSTMVSSAFFFDFLAFLAFFFFAPRGRRRRWSARPSSSLFFAFLAFLAFFLRPTGRRIAGVSIESGEDRRQARRAPGSRARQ